jgi:hypothetical protein
MIFGFASYIKAKIHYDYLIGQPMHPTGKPITNFAAIPIEEISRLLFGVY